MRDGPIIFSGPMILALLDGRKTMTRRVCKQGTDLSGANAFAVCPAKESGWIGWFGVPDPNIEEFTKKAYAHGFLCPYGRPGDRLWVKETWHCDNHATSQDMMSRREGIYYRATEIHPEIFPKWKPSIFMPRWASRITLEILNVKVERLREMHHREEEFRAEGIILPPHELYPSINTADKLEQIFIRLWDSLNKKYPWESSCWVWIIEFKRI